MATTKKTADKAAPKAPRKAAAAPKPEPAPEPPPPAAAAPAASTSSGGFRRKLVGVVISDKMHKTVTVEVQRRFLDPVYERYIRVRAHYKAHDETNQFHVGDRVEIQEHRPISRTKRWSVTRLVTSGADRAELDV